MRVLRGREPSVRAIGRRASLARHNPYATGAAREPGASPTMSTSKQSSRVRHILLIDDDPAFAQFTSASLARANLRQTVATSAEQALELLRDHPAGAFDLVLLDMTLPGTSGWDLLIQLRDAGSEIPVIVVSSANSVQDRVRGLRSGADDYVGKPIEHEELVARIDAVLRRRESLPPIEFGDVRLDLTRRKVERGGQPVPLSPREFDLLLALVRANGEVMSRDTILREVWDLEADAETNVLDVHLGRMRRKLDRHGRPLIQTVPGSGYRAVRHKPQQA